MSNETERIDAVNRFKTLDAGINNDLNDLVNLIASICNVPVALVSLIDDDMQWFKAAIGTGGLTCNERDLSFCQETIQQSDVLVVKDATQDSRFAKLPIVAGPPNIKFYAGAPLITFDGHAVGTLCVLDVKPMELTPMQVNAIKVLSKQVLTLIELNWSMQSLVEQSFTAQKQSRVIEDSELKLKAVFESSKDIHLLIGRKMEVLAFNKAAQTYVKDHYQKDIRIGSHLLNISNQAFTDELSEHISKALNGEVVNVEWLIAPESPTSCWLSVRFEPVSNDNGAVTSVAINATDITTQKLHTEQIELQNAALQRIATIQSHELRKPVASLLGLIDLVKMDDSLNYAHSPYFSHIEASVKELDAKIRGIVHESESTVEQTTQIIPELKGAC
ncbi:GAF domain-containing protein [Mucilaginibacter terrae]|uniref:PAS domain S-box-containing protein n=1 Tax=Mucilaginibacter terrae TaxID=1955052 RepID=A0ABU3GMR5_9SPHI|nr:GAF domain-containing protein [Mucilaginibacter terrae]MDT3401071.1 PAS domain S-box-containing protein [Mucilaginibacter terrae]